MVVAPVYVLEPERVSVPTPPFVSPPVPVAITLEIVISPPVPPMRRDKPDPVIVPVLSVRRPASEKMNTRPLPARVIGPAYVLVPLMFRNAPSRLTPEPLSVRGSPVTVMPPCI